MAGITLPFTLGKSETRAILALPLDPAHRCLDAIGASMLAAAAAAVVRIGNCPV